MLTEDAKVDSSSTCQLLPSSVNISAEYPALPDHDSMNNPSQSLLDCCNRDNFLYFFPISVIYPGCKKEGRKEGSSHYLHISWCNHVLLQAMWYFPFLLDCMLYIMLLAVHFLSISLSFLSVYAFLFFRILWFFILLRNPGVCNVPCIPCR